MYDRILVALDGTQSSEAVLEQVEDLASAHGSDVILLTVLPRPLPEMVGDKIVLTADQVAERSRMKAEDYLRGIAWRLGLRNIKTTYVVRFGEPAKEIADYARHNDVDLIAMTTHNRNGLHRLIVGSVSRKVMQSVNTPILLSKAA